MAGSEVERRQTPLAAASAGNWPVIQALPQIGADLECSDPGDIGVRTALEVLVEEGKEDMLAEPLAGVRAPIEWS